MGCYDWGPERAKRSAAQQFGGVDSVWHCTAIWCPRSPVVTGVGACILDPTVPVVWSRCVNRDPQTSKP
jgi:hypothetical protein